MKLLIIFTTLLILAGCGTAPMPDSEFYAKQDEVISDCNLRDGQVYRGYEFDKRKNSIKAVIGCIGNPSNF